MSNFVSLWSELVADSGRRMVCLVERRTHTEAWPEEVLEFLEELGGSCGLVLWVCKETELGSLAPVFC